MADAKISALPAASALAGTEVIPCAQEDSGLSSANNPGVPYSTDGATLPNYTLFASGKYDQANDKTWLAWEGWIVDARFSRVITYDHGSEEWDGPYTISVNPLVNDDHGNPALSVINGYGQCLSGAHNSPDMQYLVTDNQNDPSSWRLVSAQVFGAGVSSTYPRMIELNGELYCFVRGHDLTRGTVFRSTSFTDGAANWDAGVTFANFQVSGRFYQSQPIAKDNKFHFVATAANNQNTIHEDVFYFVFDPATNSLSNIDGSFTTLSGSFPVTFAQAQANYRIVTTGPQSWLSIPDLCKDDAGDVHILYSTGDDAPYHYFHTAYINGAFTVAHQLGAIMNVAPALAITPYSNGSVLCLWSEATGGPHTVNVDVQGGWMFGAARQSGGTWSDETMLQTIAPGGKALSEPKKIVDGLPIMRVTWCECVQTAEDAFAGGLKSFAYGDSGFVDGPT